MRVDIQALRYVMVVAEKQSFTRAADYLGVSQPRVSLLVKRFEDSVGFAVFQRVHGRVELTREGEVLLVKARAFIRELEEFERQVESVRRRSTALLRIGSPTYTAQIPARVWLFDEFALRNPQVRLEFVMDRTPPLVEAVEAGDLDIAVVTAPFEHKRLESLLLLRSQCLLATPKESALAQLDQITPADMKGVSVVTYPFDVGPLYMRCWYGALVDSGAQLVEANEAKAEAVLRFAATRRLPTPVQIWPGQSLPSEANAPGMVFKQMSNLDIAQELCLVRREGDDSGPIDWLWRLAVDHFHEGRLVDANREPISSGGYP